MSGKQSAKPRFGGVFFACRKEISSAPSRVFERFKWSSGPLITSSSSVRNKASEACCRCTSRHTRPTFSGTRGSVSGFHSSSLLPSLPRAHRTTAVPQWDYSLIRLVLKMQRQKNALRKKIKRGAMRYYREAVREYLSVSRCSRVI